MARYRRRGNAKKTRKGNPKTRRLHNKRFWNVWHAHDIYTAEREEEEFLARYERNRAEIKRKMHYAYEVEQNVEKGRALVRNLCNSLSSEQLWQHMVEYGVGYGIHSDVANKL
jgi:hypothetical protein